MRAIFRLSLVSPVCAILLFTVAGNLELVAQSASRNGASKPPAPDELSPAELQDAYRSLREQLRATQTTIANNRFETEANARAQATAIAEKMDAMNATLAAERRSRQAEIDRAEFERERQQTEIQQSNRSVVWVAAAFGSVGLLAMLFAALFQWRAINRMAQVIDQRTTLPSPNEYGLMLGETDAHSGRPLALSTQRLMSAIERMEQRMKKLEPKSARPLSASPVPVADQDDEAIA